MIRSDAQDDGREVSQEMLRQAKSALEAQRASIERLRARIMAMTQQATTLAVAGMTGWAALSHTQGVPSAYSAAILAAEMLWLATALFGLSSLRTRRWAEAAMIPSDFREEASPLDRSLSEIYMSLAESFGERFDYNKQFSQQLARGVEASLSLLTAAPLVAIFTLISVRLLNSNLLWGNTIGGAVSLVVAAYFCRSTIGRLGCLRCMSK